MPTPTFLRLPAERRDRLVEEAIVEFSDRAYAEASLSQISRRARIPKGSIYQYFEDKLDLYRWLLTDEVPRRKRVFIGAAPAAGDFWARLEAHVERGMAFLVEHPRLARLSAAAADPTALPEVRGLHRPSARRASPSCARCSRRGAAAVPCARPTSTWPRASSPPSSAPASPKSCSRSSAPGCTRCSPRTRCAAGWGRSGAGRLAAQAVLFIRSGLGAPAAPTPTQRKRK